MLTKRTRLIFIVCLLAGLLVFGLGCISLTRSINLKGNPNSSSVRGMTITMDVDQRQEFFTQMQKFADKHALEFTINFHDADKKSFLIAIYGDSFHITSAGSLQDSSEIAISFFNEASTPTPHETVDKLFDDLKSFINEIPNVMITEVRKKLRITMDESQREKLFTQMRKLADEHSLEFNLSFSSDKTLYLVEIYGDGFHIISDARSNPPGKFFIAFFFDYHKAPTSSSLEAVDELFNELKSSLSEIPNVTITEEE
jgi:regulator of replication initiation timing